MEITYNDGAFHLKSDEVSYIFHIIDGVPVHMYWGKALSSADVAYSRVVYQRGSHLVGDVVERFELPLYGTGDFREPVFEPQFADGSRISRLVYKKHSINPGKPKLPGLPATYANDDSEAMTLVVELEDELKNLSVNLNYTIFACGAIARSMEIINNSGEDIKISRAMSCSVDLNEENLEMVHLHGTWGRECAIERKPVIHGRQGISSTRGASGHTHNPFMALVSRNADENYGNVYAMSLVYSGNFAANCQMEAAELTRMQIGINPFDFEWTLKPGEAFHTPEAILVYSGEGLGKMSSVYHRLYRKNLCRGKFRDSERPVLINNWEGTYFDFNEQKIIDMAKIASTVGIELFVLDDGWFGKRNNDKCSLGDWVVNPEKLPSGLGGLAEKINKTGMKFGLWFEPEMISPDSDLYRLHPEWCIHVNGRAGTERRSQLVLDFSRDDVCDYIINAVSTVLKSANIEYVKWDYNRPITELGSDLLEPYRQKETAHRYMLGLYRVLDALVSEFTDILFESCSSGGGRFDPGMLYYMPQTWTSDVTDASERVKIQYGTSMVYPASTMGAHVSAIPNHQTQRNISLKTRFEVALSGNFGYELDITKMTDDELAVLREQVEMVKRCRKITQQGEFYRIKSPFENNISAWQFVSEDKEKSLFFIYRDKFKPLVNPEMPIKLKGLSPEYNYHVSLLDKVLPGDVLMNVGLVPVDWENRDFMCTVFEINKV